VEQQLRLPLGHAHSNTVFAQFDEKIAVYSYGNALDYDPKEKNLDLERHAITDFTRPPATRAWSVLWQRLANDGFPEERFTIERFKSTPMHHERFVTINHKRRDGVILDQKEDAVAMTSRDCPILVLYRRSGGPVAVLHCSRSSLTGIDLGEPERSVIHEAFRLLGPDFGQAHDACGILTMGIGAPHFHNERYPAIIADLRKRYGTAVVGGTTDRPTIDLYAWVQAQVKVHGMDPKCIVSDGLDTFTDERLASVRAKRGGHNLTIVVRA